MPRLFALIVVVVVLGLPFWWFDREDPPRPEVGELTGEVRDENGPVAGAVVRIKGKSNSVESDRHGRFHLPTPRGTEHVTASKDGYLIAGVSAKAKPLALHLERLPVGDCERYLWVDPTWATTVGANYTRRFGKVLARFQINVTNVLNNHDTQWNGYSVIQAGTFQNLPASVTNNGNALTVPGGNSRMQVRTAGNNNELVQFDPRKIAFTTTLTF